MKLEGGDVEHLEYPAAGCTVLSIEGQDHGQAFPACLIIMSRFV